MYVLIAKNDKDGKPLRAKSHIFVLRNFEERIYQKSQRYDLVLKYINLCLLTKKSVGDKKIIHQGDCKNVLCNVKLPDEKITVIRPPIGKPAFKYNAY